MKSRPRVYLSKYAISIGFFCPTCNITHRENRPSELILFGDGCDLYFTVHGRQHRLDGPAVMENSVNKECYYLWYFAGKDVKCGDEFDNSYHGQTETINPPESYLKAIES